MLYEITARFFLTMLEIFGSPFSAMIKCFLECWEDTALVDIRIGESKGKLRVGSFNRCMLPGVSNTSLSRLKGSLLKGDQLLTNEQLSTLPGGKVRGLSIEKGILKPQVERKLLGALGVKTE